jgi:hypothetical protein
MYLHSYSKYRNKQKSLEKKYFGGIFKATEGKSRIWNPLVQNRSEDPDSY